MDIRRRPSLLGALLWIAIGVLFLLYNFGFINDFWSLAGRYWPVLLILLGLGKILDYFLRKEAFSIRAGEIIGILLLLLIGTFLTKVSRIHVGQLIRNIPIQIGDTRVDPGQFIGDSHTFSEEVSFPLESSVPIRIENAYGSVSVAPGVDREIRVTLKKVIYANEARAKSIADEIRVQGAPEGSLGPASTLKPEAEPGKPGSRTFVIRTNRDSLTQRNYIFSTDMEILVPKNSQVAVVNNYGEVTVAEINGILDLSTTNKSLEVRDCTGEFKISTRYAECRLTNLKGNLNVDGRGDLEIEKISGDVTVRNEYSPSQIREVNGKVSVTSTEGSLLVEQVSKPVVINARGTKVEVAGLKEGLKLIASHRDIDISDVAAAVSIDSRYATLNLKDIRGDMIITSSSDTINAEQLRGRLTLKARGTGIHANDVLGPLDIQTTLKDVVINNFGGSCSISNEYAGISASSRSLGNDVHIKNRSGEVNLFLPDEASFLIDATARNGRIETDYAGLFPTRNSNTGSLKSKVKAGGPKIILETEYSDIHVYRTGQGHQEPDEAETMSPWTMPDPADMAQAVPPQPFLSEVWNR